MNEAIVTQWFELSQQKPWEPGVYECMLEHLGSRVLFGYFDGQSFVRFEHDIDRLLDRKHKGTFASCVKWRGLASSPSAPKKRAGNKRKTAYLLNVSRINHGIAPRVVAVFSSAKVANSQLEKELALMKSQDGATAWLTHIRFRTPEA